jgi:iron complex transport system substrate-binding protein
MRKQFVSLVAAGLAAFAAIESHAGISLADDRGHVINLERPAGRIVTLAPNLAELSFAAGAGAQLVGVSAFSDFPAEAHRLPVVASSEGIEYERLVGLKPELVLSWLSGNRAHEVARLEQLGFKVFATEVQSLPDIARILRSIGRLAGTEAAAEHAAARYELALEALRARYATDTSLRVFFEISHTPLMTVNGRHLISDALATCGGRNVYAGASALTPAVSLEQLLALDPDVIILSADTGDEAAHRAAFDRLGALKAVRAGRIYAIDPHLMLSQGPRLLQGVEQLCGALALARSKKDAVR